MLIILRSRIALVSGILSPTAMFLEATTDVKDRAARSPTNPALEPCLDERCVGKTTFVILVLDNPFRISLLRNTERLRRKEAEELLFSVDRTIP